MTALTVLALRHRMRAAGARCARPPRRRSPRSRGRPLAGRGECQLGHALVEAHRERGDEVARGRHVRRARRFHVLVGPRAFLLLPHAVPATAAHLRHRGATDGGESEQGGEGGAAPGGGAGAASGVSKERAGLQDSRRERGAHDSQTGHLPRAIVAGVCGQLIRPDTSNLAPAAQQPAAQAPNPATPSPPPRPSRPTQRTTKTLSPPGPADTPPASPRPPAPTTTQRPPLPPPPHSPPPPPPPNPPLTPPNPLLARRPSVQLDLGSRPLHQETRHRQHCRAHRCPSPRGDASGAGSRTPCARTGPRRTSVVDLNRLPIRLPTVALEPIDTSEPWSWYR